MHPGLGLSGSSSISRYLPTLFLLAALPLWAAAAPIRVVQGEEIPLRGVATGTDVVYLFMTGPNLPDQGIALIGGTTVTTGVSGSFTRVDVNADGTWSYAWRTGSVGRILDSGTYLIFITEEPLSKPDLDDTAFSEQAVIFGGPVETVTMESPVTTVTIPPGTMQGGPLLTGMQTPGGSTPTTTTPPPTTPGRLGLMFIIPLGAAALALLIVRRRL